MREVGGAWHEATSSDCLVHLEAEGGSAIGMNSFAAFAYSLFPSRELPSFRVLAAALLFAVALAFLARSPTVTLSLLLLAGGASAVAKKRTKEKGAGEAMKKVETQAQEGKRDDNCGCLKSFIPQALLKSMKLKGIEDAFKMGIGGCYRCDE